MPEVRTPGLGEALRRNREREDAVAEYDRMIAGLGDDLQRTIERAGQSWWVKPSVLVQLIEDSASDEDLNFVGGLAAQLDDDRVVSEWESKYGELQEIARRKADEGFQWGDVADPFKGVIRTAGSAMESAWQETQGLFRAVVAGGRDAPSAVDFAKDLGSGDFGGTFAQNARPRRGNRSVFENALGQVEGEGYVGSQSTFGITMGKLFSGDISAGQVLFGDEEALGHGFFSGGAVNEEQRSRAYRSAHIGDQSLTPGRLVASAVSEPGEWQHRWLSGAIDAGLIIYADPINPVLGKVGESVRAGRYFEADDGRRLLGLVQGQRRSVTEAAEHWLSSTRSGARFVERLAGMTDPGAIWEASRRQIPVEWAVQLADEADPDAVRALATKFLGTEVARKPKGWHYSNSGIAVRNWTTGNRLFGEMPRSGLLDTFDPDAVVTQVADELKNAHVPADEINGIVTNTMRAMTSGPPGVPLASDRYAVLTSVKEAVDAQMRAAGVRPSKASRVNRIWNSYERLRAYNIDVMTGIERPLPSINVGGVVMDAPTPQSLEQFLSRYVPMPDTRSLREISKRTARVAALPGGQKAATAAIGASLAVDTLMKVWKPLQLIRAAYVMRIGLDEQARIAAAGHSSMFSSPLSYFGLAIMDDGRLGKILDQIPGVTVGRYAAGVKGERFTTTAGKVGSRMEAVDADGAIADALYNSTNDLLFGEKTRRVPGFIPIRRGEAGFHDAWLDEVKFLHDNPIAQRLAAGEPIDDIMEWYWGSSYRTATLGSGDVSRFAAGTAGAGASEKLAPLARQVQTRAGADEYVRHMQQWLEDVTRGDGGLIEAVATGRLPSDVATHGARSKKVASGTATHRNMKPTRGARAHVEDLDARGQAPEFVRGSPQLATMESAGDWWRDAVDLMMDVVAVRPSNWASRSPEFRQAYWQRVEETLDLATPKAKARLMKAARGEARLPKDVIERLDAIDARGTLDIDDMNALAGQHAADATKKLLYDLHNRSRFFDAMRLIFPFGEAWKEVVTTWSRLLSENPRALRTLQRTVTGARGAGAVYKDEVTGEEMFTIPGSKALAKAFTGIDADFRASTAGLSIAGSVLPGVGPAVQWGVGTFLPDKPEYDFIRDIVFQFGGEDEGIVKTFVPGWAEKLQKWLGAPESDRQFNAAVGESLNALASTGDYDLQDDEDLERLQDDAVAAAGRVFLLRGILQFFAPSAPQPRLRVQTDEGPMVGAALREAFYKLQQLDYESAVGTFVERFGAGALIAAVPFTRTEINGKPVYGIRPSAEFGRFERTHEGLFSRFPRVAGLFGPQDPGYDFQVYERQAREFRETKSSNERLGDLNSMLGRLAFDHYKSMVPVKPNREQQRWLADVRRELVAEYPGYNPKDFNPGDVAGAIDELVRAVDHDSLGDNGTAAAVREYFTYRDQAIAAAPTSGWQTAKGARPLRDWLRSVADEISDEEPEFRRVWDQLLSRELADDLEVEDEERVAA